MTNRKSKKLTVLGVSFMLAAIMYSSVHAKKIYPGEIVGRDLDYPYLGWLGHVGIATADMSSAKGMLQNANLVIEILKEGFVA